MKNTKIFICLGLMLFSLGANAQDEEKKSKPGFFEKRKAHKHEIRLKQTRYQTIGTSALIDVAYDSKISNNVYNGVGLGLSLGGTKFDPRYLHVSQVDLMATAQSGPNTFSQYQPRVTGIDSWLKWLTDSNDHYRMALGGGYRYNYTARVNPSLGNSTYTHDIFASLVGSFYYDRELELKGRNFTVDFKADLDLFSYINRHPGYSVIGTFKNYLRPVGGFTNISTTVGITLPITKYTRENKMRIHYSWNAYGMAEFERSMKLRVAYHRVGITYYFKY